MRGVNKLHDVTGEEFECRAGRSSGSGLRPEGTTDFT